MKAIPEILIVENNEMTLEILTIVLTKKNYHVTIAHDTNEAIAIASEKKFALVLVSILVPPRSGFEVIKFFTTYQKDVPVVVLSTQAEEEKTVEESFLLGVADFIAKPFNPNELLLRIKRLL
jgi:DNA-binding response OmpR family regulator